MGGAVGNLLGVPRGAKSLRWAGEWAAVWCGVGDPGRAGELSGGGAAAAADPRAPMAVAVGAGVCLGLGLASGGFGSLGGIGRWGGSESEMQQPSGHTSERRLQLRMPY